MCFQILSPIHFYRARFARQHVFAGDSLGCITFFCPETLTSNSAISHLCPRWSKSLSLRTDNQTLYTALRQDNQKLYTGLLPNNKNVYTGLRSDFSTLLKFTKHLWIFHFWISSRIILIRIYLCIFEKKQVY